MVKGKILVVDDDSEVLKILSDICRGLGFDVESYLSSLDVVERLERNGVQDLDLVISDYKMPNKNGIELLKIFMASDFSLPFIVLTGFSDRKMAIEALNHGAFALSEKPINAVELRNFIHRAYQMRSFHRISRLLLDDSEVLIGVQKEISAAYEKRFARAENIIYNNMEPSQLKDTDVMGIIKGMSEVSGPERTAFEVSRRVRDLRQTYQTTLGDMQDSFLSSSSEMKHAT